MTELEKLLNEPLAEDDLFFNCRQNPYPNLKDMGGVQGIKGQYNLRNRIRQEYCFAILTEAMIEKIKPYGRILEIGAGTGYWAYEIKKRGVDYLATDAHPGRENKYFAGARAWERVYSNTAVDAVKRFPDQDLAHVLAGILRDLAGRGFEGI